MHMVMYVLIFVCAALTGPALAVAHAKAAPGNISLVIVPPWHSSAAVVTAGDGQLVGPILSRVSVLAVSDNPDFFDDVKAAGAWFVLDGNRWAHLCGAIR